MKFILLATAAAINNPVAPSQVALQHDDVKSAPVVKPVPVAAAYLKVPQQDDDDKPGNKGKKGKGKKGKDKKAIDIIPPMPALHALGSKVIEDPPAEEKKEEKKEEAPKEENPPAEDAKSLQDKVDAMRKEMCEKDPSKDGCEEFRTTTPAPKEETTPAPKEPETQAPATEAPPAAPKVQPIKESIPVPSQGFEGAPVQHDDMESQTADWRQEYGKNGPVPPPPSAAATLAILPILALLL